MNKDEIILQLGHFWQRCLVDHHKDSDCHFRLGKIFSYGSEERYFASHEGYINDFYEEFDTLEEAQDYLINTIKTNIVMETNPPLSEDYYDEEQRKSLLKTRKEFLEFCLTNKL